MTHIYRGACQELFAVLEIVSYTCIYSLFAAYEVHAGTPPISK